MAAEIDIGKIREEFPHVKKWAFMNHAACSPCPRSVRKAIERHLEDWTDMSPAFWDLVPFAGEEGTKRSKEVFARFVGARTDEIALVPNTNLGLNAIVHSLKYPHGSNVVMADPRLEHPTTLIRVLKENKGVDLRYVWEDKDHRIPVDGYGKVVDDKTVFVFCGHVEYSTGVRNQLPALAEIAHKHGAYLLVDGFQAAGALEVDVKRLDVDFYSTGTYKWLMGIKGASYLYVRDDLIERLTPGLFGWAPGYRGKIDTFAKATDGQIEDWHKTASRFETGSESIIGSIANEAALNLFESVGMPNIERRIFKITDYLIEKLQEMGVRILTPLDHGWRAGIVTFVVKDPVSLHKSLLQKSIWVSANKPLNAIRVSPHFYNNKEEIDLLISELTRLSNLVR